MKKASTNMASSIDPAVGIFRKSSPSLETAENMTIPRKSTSAERLRSSGASSSSLVDQTDNGGADGQASQSQVNLAGGK